MRCSLSFHRIIALVVLLVAAVPSQSSASSTALPDGLYAEFTTAHGTIVAELFFTHAPLTVASFVGLAEGNLGPTPRKPFFDGLTFHRVVPGFVVQGGDPLGTGEGGPGYEFPDEFVPGLRHDAAGMLSMANSGPDTNGSQFFFTLAPVNRLNYLHSVFGRVVQGVELLPRIGAGDATTSVTIHRIGAAAQAFRADEDAFTALAAKTARATLPHFDDPDGVLPAEPPRARAFDLKLANVKRATGAIIYARVFEKFTPKTPAQRPGNLARTLARQLAIGDDAVLAVYFADTQQWGLWIGDQLVPHFMGRPGTVQEFTKGGAFHEAKQAFLAAAKAHSDELIAHAQNTGPVSPSFKTKLVIDGVIDALILKFESRQQ